jgi:hypothetical protein
VALAGTLPGGFYRGEGARTMGLSVAIRRCVIAVLTIGALATLVKFGANYIDSTVAEFYSGARSISIEDARQKGVLVAVFQTEPMTVNGDGKTFEFGEAWLEAAYLPTHPFIWFSGQRRADWNFLLVRPKTDCFNYRHHEYFVKPEYAHEFAIPDNLHSKSWIVCSGITEDGVRFDYYHQIVSPDLRELKLRAEYSPNNGIDWFSIGTATLTAVEE